MATTAAMRPHVVEGFRVEDFRVDIRLEDVAFWPMRLLSITRLDFELHRSGQPPPAHPTLELINRSLLNCSLPPPSCRRLAPPQPATLDRPARAPRRAASPRCER